MKRILFFAAGICALVACSMIEQTGPQDGTPLAGDTVERVVFEVLPIKDADDPETKALAVPSDNGSTVSFQWEVTDTVGIYPDLGSQVYFTMENGAGTSSADFNGGAWALKQNNTYVSYYPFVGDFYLDRDKIPVSFLGQKQVGTVSPFVGARYFLATDATTSDNGVLRFTYSTLNTIIHIKATLPAGTYTKASLTVDEPLFVEEGTYSLDDKTIVGKKYSKTLSIDLEDFTLTEQAQVPVYIMSAPVDLEGKEVIVKFISNDGKSYTCTKTPSSPYLANYRYGLNCVMERETNIINFADSEVKRICVENWDEDGDGELSCDEASLVSSIDDAFNNNSIITSFNELVFFVGLNDISDGAFYGCRNLESVTLPNTIQNIGWEAFGCCRKLNSINIPNSVNTISEASFDGCWDLSYIDIPESVTAIKSSAFQGCKSLSSIRIPSSVTEIGNQAFSQCENLESIEVDINNGVYDSRNDCNAIIETVNNTLIAGCNNSIIPNSVTCIGANSFYGSKGLSSIVIPNSVESIEGQAFRGCTGLSSINIPNSVSVLGGWVFYGCSSLSSVVLSNSLELIDNYLFGGCSSLLSIVIPESITMIGYDVFNGCSSLVSIDIPNSVTSIGSECFWGCTSLTSIRIPDGVSIISSFSFCQCSSLTTLIIPSSVNSIYSYAFQGCSSLTSITIESVSPPSGSSYMFRNTSCPIYVPAGSVEAYKAAEYWSDYAERIQAIPPEAVDLGLSVKWASFNLGASAPEEYGDYYAWGETEPKSNYDWSTYKWCNGNSTSLTKYNDSSSYGTVDNKTVLDPEDDAAHVKLGGNWRMPTDAEWTELRDNCTWTWVTNYNGSGINGRLVTGTNGNSIFLPAAGIRNNAYLSYAGSGGYYCSSSLFRGYPISAHELDFDSSGVYWSTRYRCYGPSVRPVTE